MVPSPAHAATLLLLAVAYATCEVASYLDGQPRIFGVVFGLAVFAFALVLALFVRPRHPDAPPSRRLSLALGAALVLPLALEPILRNVTGDGFPLEMQLVNGLRILGLLLAGLGAWRACRRLASVVALFLALFASAMGDQPAIPYLLVAFALTGGLWLILEHQSNESTSHAALVGELDGRVPLRLPYREGIVFGVLVLAALGIALAGPNQVRLTLGEWLPTSGGTGDTDPFARHGVGDGPEETAGDDARAAGMVESNKMIEDNKNSLIDAVNDMFGAPHKPPKDQERMVAAGQVDVIEFHGRLPENRRPSRDFDTGRTGPKGMKRPESQSARGLFEVEGRTPLHVRLVAYGDYDAAAHRWIEGRQPMSRMLEPDGGDWMRLTNFRDAGWYAADERHRLKVADLKSNLVPTPALTTRVRIHRVDRPDYYAWDYEGVLSIAGRTRTPPGVVVSTDSRTLDPARLGEEDFPPRDPRAGELPRNLSEPIGDLARAWAGGHPRGWPQISSIVETLRANHLLDSKASAPPDGTAPVAWFLFESKRGPDYLFATSACLMLRSLGYSSRVCLGYYAAPEAYDAETGHTPVTVRDLHVWPEVLLRDGHWLVIEPTPGYGMLPPARSWADWLDERFTAAMNFTSRNAIPLGLSVFTVGLLAVYRRRVLDRIHTWLWIASPGRTWQAAVLRAARLIDRRARLAGQPRPATQTLRDWSRRIPDPAFDEFVRLVEHAVYAPDLPPPMPPDAALDVCRRAVRSCRLPSFASGVSA
jgi:transglutaminase-like putative cysteine protease